MKNKVTNTLAQYHLAPAFRLREQFEGGMTALLHAYRKATGEDVKLLQLERWLHLDENKRVQPALGKGLLLAKLAESLIRKNRQP